MIEETKEANKPSSQNGNMPNNENEEKSPHSGYTSDKSPGIESITKKRFGFKSVGTASRFASRMSPKSQRKRSKLKPALCKVHET